jgi:hypothetical protein
MRTVPALGSYGRQEAESRNGQNQSGKAGKRESGKGKQQGNENKGFHPQINAN